MNATLLVDVSHVVAAAPEDAAVGIERPRQTFRADEVVRRSVRILQQFEPHVPRGMELIVRYRLCVD